MFGFVLGALTGAVAVGYWGCRIREFAESNTIGARKSVADVLRSLAEMAERVPDRTAEQFGTAGRPGKGTIDPTSLG